MQKQHTYSLLHTVNTITASVQAFPLDPCMGWVARGPGRAEILLNRMGRAGPGSLAGRAINFLPTQARFTEMSRTHSALIRSFQCMNMNLLLTQLGMLNDYRKFDYRIKCSFSFVSHSILELLIFFP